MDKLFSAGNSLFNSNIVPSTEGIATRVEGLLNVTIIYEWPAMELSTKEKLTILSLLTTYGRSDDENADHWSTWLYSYIVLCFPQMKEKIQSENRREYVFRPLPSSFISQLLAYSKAVLTNDVASSELSNADQNNDKEDQFLEHIMDIISSIESPSSYPDLIPSLDSFPLELIACNSLFSVYGYCALLIFLAGKQINDRNVTTISERRPQNLIDTYKIPPIQQFILTGEGKMMMKTFQMCNFCWSLHAPLRKAIIVEVAYFAKGNSTPIRVVYTISKLLEYVGMQQAYYIHHFLQSFPEVIDYACLKPSLAAYSHSILQLERENSVTRPYFKVIYGDMTKAFHRNSILPLAAVAINYHQKTMASIRNYNLGEGAALAIAMFEREAKARGSTKLLITNQDDLEDAELK